MDCGSRADGVIRYLSAADVRSCLADVDVVAVVEQTLKRHAAGDVLLPPESYLGWTTDDGHDARSLAMHGGVRNRDGLAVGVKLINASLGNTARGLARAQGLVALFDPLTARPTTLMEAAHVSAMRTAAVTAVTARHLLIARTGRMAVLGCGALARAHLALVPTVVPVAEVVLYDEDVHRRRTLAAQLRATPGAPRVIEADRLSDAVRDCDLVVTVTTATSSYLPFDDLAPGAVVAHVSLDDLYPDAVLRADVILVDDWTLVADDDRRLFGRMIRGGLLLPPGGGAWRDVSPHPSARRVDALIGDLLLGRHPGRRRPEDIVISNPFGMAVLDVAVAAEVVRVARTMALGIELAA